MRVLGIDPGLNVTGYGIVDSDGEQVRLVETGVVRSDASTPLAVRLNELARGVREILDQFRPDAVAVEDLYSHYAHPKTAIIMGHARGIVFFRAAEAGVEVYQYAATRIKKSLTGNGRASKEQVQLMIKSAFALPCVMEPSDASDALATALCHCRTLQNLEGVAS